MKSITKIFLVISFTCGTLTVISCDPADSQPSDVTHPNPDYLPPLAELTSKIVSSESSGVPRLDRLAATLRASQAIDSIGTLDGPQATVFGLIRDIAIGPSNSAYVLDSRYNKIRHFDSEGEFIDDFGGPGSGPTEFESPVAFDLTEDGRLVVADRGNQAKLFRKRDSGFEYSTTIRADLVPEGACFMGDNIILRGWTSDGSVVHAFDSTATIERSFGDGYKSPNLLVNDQLSEGMIACDPAAGAVIVSYQFLPYLWGYSASGELLWSARIADFMTQRVTERFTADGRPQVVFHGGEIRDFPVTMTPWIDGVMILQIGRLDERGEETERTIRTFLVSSRTGQGVYVSNSFPMILAADSTVLLGSTIDPYPQLVRFRVPIEMKEDR